MKKLKISFVLIRSTKVGDIAGVTTVMTLAIFDNTLVFTGTKPFTQIEIDLIISTYNAKKAAYKLGGTLQREPYRLAKIAIYDCVKQFGGYVNELADGNRIILELSTLPIDEPSDTLAKILAGATANLVTGTQGSTLQLITDCAAFGKDVGYITIVSEDEPTPIDLLVAANGQVTLPLALTYRVFISGTLARRKIYNGLVLGKKYFITTLLVYGDLVGARSTPVLFVCSK